MLRRPDCLLIRVESLKAATSFWRDSLGAALIEQAAHSSRFELEDEFAIVLHDDESLPEQAWYLRVDSVRDWHERRESLRLTFLSPPTRGSRGWHAVVRDPFGTVLRIADVEHDHESTPAMREQGLFGAIESKHQIDALKLIDLYQHLERTADDLPYTAQFESLYDEYISQFPEPKPKHAEVWRHLLTLRKSGRLPKHGAAKSPAPDVSEDDRQLLTQLAGESIGRRDRLPYSEEFDQLCEAFNKGRRRPFSPHQIWRLLASLAK
ncbi:MAG TPA: hypothetical protein PK402_06235 [Tepidisphaeraceae bacterium]|nr:hypothetical protein [Tepidisphaeraceae bacterium]